MLAIVGVATGSASLADTGDAHARPPRGHQRAFECAIVRVIDGDTLDCDGRRVRLAGIDAPEWPGHCRRGRTCTPGDARASTDNLARLARPGPVVCRPTGSDVYRRTIALCTAGARDLSCAQVEAGHAVYRYGAIRCRGGPGRKPGG